ncbi:MAG TPA: hypothetical protein VD969_14515 [Symbiobacteriaceae bacterium]|nr:hypothetical protein [Symbiobacteriaceae bacterium]
MAQAELRTGLLQQLRSGAADSVVDAAKRLLELGELGSPAGTFSLMGGKAAIGVGRLADAVVLLYHGLRVAEPNTKVWAELLVNRAIACAHHGFYLDAICAGEQFLALTDSLPADTATFIPYAHHAVAFAQDRRKEYLRAVAHYRRAAELHADPVQRAITTSDLAYALILAGQTDDADAILSRAEACEDRFATFVLACTTTLLRYHQGHFSDAFGASQRAESLACGNEKLWANPLAELWYWQSRIVWEMGDRRSSAALALRASVKASELWNLGLRDKADEWLAELLDKGGIR